MSALAIEKVLVDLFKWDQSKFVNYELDIWNQFM